MLILELWIIRSSGEPLIHVVHKKHTKHNKNEDLFIISGLMSAIQMVVKDRMDSIKMEKTKLIVLPSNNYFIVAVVPIDEKKRKVCNHLKKIKNKFDKHYTIDNKSWTGCIAEFQDFYPYLTSTYNLRNKEEL